MTEAKPVTLKDVQGAYYALGILVFMAACILMAEKALRIMLPSSQDEKSDMVKGFASSGYIPNGYVANGYITNGDTKGVSNGVANGYSNEVANGYSNGVVSNVILDKYGRDVSQYVSNGDVTDKKKKKKKSMIDMESGAPVFSKSLWS